MSDDVSNPTTPMSIKSETVENSHLENLKTPDIPESTDSNQIKEHEAESVASPDVQSKSPLLSPSEQKPASPIFEPSVESETSDKPDEPSSLPTSVSPTEPKIPTPHEFPIDEPYVRDPNDIEDEIQKVTLAGYTQDDHLVDTPAPVILAQTQTVPHSVSVASEISSKISSTEGNTQVHDIYTPESITSPVAATPSDVVEPPTSPAKTPSKIPEGPKSAKPTTVKRPPVAPISKITTPRTQATVKSSQTKPPSSAASSRLHTTPANNALKRPTTTPADKRTPTSGTSVSAKQTTVIPRKMPTSSSRTSSVSRTAAPPSRSGSETPKNTPPAIPRNKKYENVQSRIQASSDHKPSGGNVKIFSQKVTVQAASKVGSLQNAKHVPGGGQVKIENKKINFKENAKPKVDAKNEGKIIHNEKKIPTQQLQWKAESKVGSLLNASHKPAGGDVKIFSQKVKVDSVVSKVGSLDNADHKPTGGNVKISDYKVQTKTNSSANSIASHSSTNSRRSSANASRAKMPGCKDPISPEQALGIQ